MNVDAVFLKSERLQAILRSAMSEMIEPIKSILVAGPLLDPQKHTEWDDYGSYSTYPLPWYLNTCNSRYLFKWDFELPEFSEAYEYYFEVSTGREGQWDAVNPQLLVYIGDEQICGLDTNHRKIHLKAEFSGRAISVQCTLFTGMNASDLAIRVQLMKRSRVLHQAYWDLKVITDVIKALPEGSEAKPPLLHEINRLLDETQFGSGPYSLEISSVISSNESIIKINIEDMPLVKGAKRLSESLWRSCYGVTENLLPDTVHAVGHTHIDIAWLWDLIQTQEKVVRSYQTAIDLQSRYPEYRFMASQPILYEMLEAAAPKLMDTIIAAQQRGCWESDGGMYLEADCNLSSGESLIRQFEVGQKYIAQKFNGESKTLWLPDVFGYSAALPQILKGFGIQLFVTSKISWNDTNKLPYDDFLWKGIDGTVMPTQFITTASMETFARGDHRTIYEGNMTPSEVLGCALRNQQRLVQPHALMPFGYGDGGGGATEEMLETARRLTAGVKGMPKLKMSSVTDFVDAYLETDLEKLPIWRGELYLEYHRGTYTTNAGVKRRYRQLEDLLLFSERYAAASFLTGAVSANAVSEFGREANPHWKTLLLNAFHDILPGTSIEKVYLDAYTQMDQSASAILEALTGLEASIKKENGAKVAAKLTDAFVNCVDFPASGPLPIRQYGDAFCTRIALVDIHKPIEPMGYLAKKDASILDLEALTYTHVALSEGQALELETENYAMTFNAAGDLISLWDRIASRSVLRQNGTGFRLMAYEDRPMRWDAWDIDKDYVLHPMTWNPQTLVEVVTDNPHALVVRITRGIGQSRVCQSWVFYKALWTKRIDIFCHADWHEHQVLLRTDVDLEINPSLAVYDIQFGHVGRPNDANHSYHDAMFEVCAQHWGNLAEGGYHVTLMSNEKFGYNARDSKLGMSLIKSPTWPNPHSDQGPQNFAYALLPMQGAVDYAKVHAAAMVFCKGLRAMSVNAGVERWYPELPANLSLASYRVLDEGMVELRLIEMANRRGSHEFKLPVAIQAVHRTDLAGRLLNSIPIDNARIKLAYKPFELITLRCILNHTSEDTTTN